MALKYMAIGKNNVTGSIKASPRAAALAFFERYPLKRVCSVVEGEENKTPWLACVPVSPHRHRCWRDVTKAQIDVLFPADEDANAA